MSDDYTPTTEDVRLVYGSDRDGWPDGRRLEAFSRYLAAHDAEVREQTLAPIRAALGGHPVCDVHPDDDPVSCGWKRAVADVRRALDA
jgi:hypothetical protein